MPLPPALLLPPSCPPILCLAPCPGYLICGSPHTFLPTLCPTLSSPTHMPPLHACLPLPAFPPHTFPCLCLPGYLTPLPCPRVTPHLPHHHPSLWDLLPGRLPPPLPPHPSPSYRWMIGDTLPSSCLVGIPTTTFIPLCLLHFVLPPFTLPSGIPFTDRMLLHTVLVQFSLPSTGLPFTPPAIVPYALPLFTPLNLLPPPSSTLPLTGDCCLPPHALHFCHTVCGLTACSTSPPHRVNTLLPFVPYLLPTLHSTPPYMPRATVSLYLHCLPCVVAFSFLPCLVRCCISTFSHEHTFLPWFGTHTHLCRGCCACTCLPWFPHHTFYLQRTYLPQTTCSYHTCIPHAFGFLCSLPDTAGSATRLPPWFVCSCWCTSPTLYYRGSAAAPLHRYHLSLPAAVDRDPFTTYMVRATHCLLLPSPAGCALPYLRCLRLPAYLPPYLELLALCLVGRLMILYLTFALPAGEEKKALCPLRLVWEKERRIPSACLPATCACLQAVFTDLDIVIERDLY